MSAKPTNRRPPQDLIGPFPSCALDDAGRVQQAARYAQLAATVAGIERKPETIVVRFDERLDHELLERALAVERECCPFFVFQFAGSEQRLTISVRRPDQQPALDAIAAGFETGHQGRTGSEPCK